MKEIDAVILANGDYPSASLPLRVLEEAPYVVCCDGGANEYIARGYEDICKTLSSVGATMIQREENEREMGKQVCQQNDGNNETEFDT